MASQADVRRVALSLPGRRGESRLATHEARPLRSMVVGHRARTVLLSTLLFGPASLLKQTEPLRHVTIVATDYAYRVPASVPAGMTAFRFVNRGTHPHEVQLFRFLPGVTARTARAYVATGAVPDSAADASGSVLIALPGVTAHEEVLVSLVAGERYGLMCEFRDAPTKPKHTALGMVALLEVRS